MSTNPFLALIRSRKFLLTLAAAIGLVASFVTRQIDGSAFVAGLCSLVVGLVLAIAHEDAAEKSTPEVDAPPAVVPPTDPTAKVIELVRKTTPAIALVALSLGASACGVKGAIIKDVVNLADATCHVVEDVTANPYVEMVCEYLDSQKAKQSVQLRMPRAAAAKLVRP